jgi:hypothetical protein
MSLLKPRRTILALFKRALTDLCRVVVRALGPKDTEDNDPD